MGNPCGGEVSMREVIEALLYGGNEMNIWDEKRYVKEEQKIRDMFLNDPEFMEYIARMRTLKSPPTPKMANI
jgi:hypothetical protein